MIDLAEMKDVAVDPERATATAQGGVTWGELNDADRRARPGRHRRRGLHHRHRRANPRRRARLADGASTGSRPTTCSRVELVTADGEVLEVDAELAPRPVLGAAWRRRQLRRRHLVHLPPAPGRDGHRRADRPPDRRRARAAALLPRRGRRRLRRPDRVRRAGARAGRLGHQARRAGRLPRRRRRRRPSASSRRSRLRVAADGRGRPDALPGDEHAARRRLPRRARSTTGSRASPAASRTR